VVIVGARVSGGLAGGAGPSPARAPCAVTLVDRGETTTVFQPLLYQVAMGGASAPPEIAVPIPRRPSRDDRKHQPVLMDEVHGVSTSTTGRLTPRRRARRSRGTT